MPSSYYNAAPPSHLLPSAERQAELAAYLDEMPGIDVRQSIEEESASTWPQDGLHVASLIRPGFSGNVTITPYRTVEQAASAGYLILRGCGQFTMLYENSANMSDVPPNAREYPDFVSLDLSPAFTEIIPLENGGRLLLQKDTTDARDCDSERQIEDRESDGVISVERLVANHELRPLMACLAISTGLKGNDADTFTEQPFRKIERFIAPQHNVPATHSRWRPRRK